MIKIMIAIIAITFILYFGFRYTDQQKSKIATVNGEIINELEYKNTRKMFVEMLQKQYRQYHMVLNDKILKSLNLDKKVLDDLVNGKLLSQEAGHIGLNVTQKELQDHILTFPAFQNQGHFDENRYAALLREKNMQPPDFEKEQSKFLLMQKTKQFLTRFTPVTKQELLDFYSFMNQKVKISFIQIPSNAFEKSVTVDPKAMQAYFNKNRETYRVPDKIKVAYMIVDPEAFKDKITIDEKDIQAYYEDNQSKYEEKKQIKARHILFRVDLKVTPAEEANIKEKAMTVLKRAQAGEDFAKLAKEFSQDESTAPNGGLLEYFTEAKVVRPFGQEAFKLKKGEVSHSLVRTEFGYHIIKVEDIKEAKTWSLEEVRPEIIKKLSAAVQSEDAYNKADDLLHKFPYDMDLKKYAEQNGLPAKESGYFAQDENIPEWTDTQKINAALFDLNKGDLSEIIEFQNKFYIFQVLDPKPSYLPELKEVQDKVQKAFTESLAKLEAQKEAEKVLAKLKQGEAWENFTKDSRFLHATTNFFKRNENLPELSNVPELKEAAFELNAAQKYPAKVFENDTGAFIIKWEANEDIDQAKYAEEMQNSQGSLQDSKNQILVNSWMEFLKTSGRIEIIRQVEQEP
jgi:peptidyl-prolyl cis-trans isomerase D